MVKQALSSQPCYISLDRPWGTFALHVGQGWENLFNTSHVQDSAVLLFFQLSISSTEHSKNSCLFHMDCWKSKIFRSQKLQHKLCIDGEHTQQMCNVVAPFTHHTQELLLGSAEHWLWAHPALDDFCMSDKFIQPRLLFPFFQDTDIFLAGTEEGHIHLCSCSGKEQILGTYRGHKVSDTLQTRTAATVQFNSKM